MEYEYTYAQVQVEGRIYLDCNLWPAEFIICGRCVSPWEDTPIEEVLRLCYTTPVDIFKKALAAATFEEAVAIVALAALSV